MFTNMFHKKTTCVYRNNFCTTESIYVLQNQFLYYRINFCTTESISVLQKRFPYYRINFRAGEGHLKSGEGHLKSPLIEVCRQWGGEGGVLPQNKFGGGRFIHSRSGLFPGNIPGEYAPGIHTFPAIVPDRCSENT